MKKKLCCILMLIVLLLNSSILLVISEAVEAVSDAINENSQSNENNEEEKIKALGEINLTKYENFDTTQEDSDSDTKATGDKGVLVQFNLKTGISFAEGEEYHPIKKTSTNIELPWIGDYKPERVEVITKSTQATNGDKKATFDYHSSTGILQIIAENENSEYTKNVIDARDEYEVICLYKEECYAEGEERNIDIRTNVEEILANEDETRISTRVKPNYTLTDNISGVISTEHETEDIYDGYIVANSLSSANNYETKYNEKLNIMVSNKDLVQKIELTESSETALFTESSIDKEQVLEMLGDKGSIEILNQNGDVLITVNKDTETDENGKVKVTYENKTQNIYVRLNNINKEGIIEIENTRVIDNTAQIVENSVKTQVNIRGIETIEKIEAEEERTEDVVKYERFEECTVELKQAKSEIDTKINVGTLVNNTTNDVVMTATLKTDNEKYSLFKNPEINIEMPGDVRKVKIGETEVLYGKDIFQIESSKITTNSNGNKVVTLKLQGTQTQYQKSSLVDGVTIQIPLKITLNKSMESKVGNINVTYSNEMTGTQENRSLEVTLLNKVVNIVPSAYEINNSQGTVTTGQNGSTVSCEKDGVTTQVVEEVGNVAISNNGTIYEEQIIEQNVNIINSSNSAKRVKVTLNVPDEMVYVIKVDGDGCSYHEQDGLGYYDRNQLYEYREQTDKQVTIEVDLKAGESKTELIELKVKDLQDSEQEKQTTINYEMQVNNAEITKFAIQNVVKQAEIRVETRLYIEGEFKENREYGVEIFNLTDRTLENEKLVFQAFDKFEITSVLVGNQVIQVDGGNIWSTTIKKLEPGKPILYTIDGHVTDDIYDEEDTTYEMTGVSTIYGDDINTYVSNEARMNGYLEAVELDMTTDKTEIKQDEEVTYTINIRNTGKTWGVFGKHTNINVQDIIPRELQPISIEYNNFTTNIQKVKKPVIIPQPGGPEYIEFNSYSYTENTVTKEISNTDIPDGYDEEDAPNIDLQLTIPEGKSITMTIKAKAKMITEDTEITNTMTAKGYYIKSKEASATIKVLKYNHTEEPDTIEVTGVTLNKNVMNLKISTTEKLIATVLPDNATNKNVTWESSAPAIASVDSEGNVTGIINGIAIITVTTEDGGKTARCTVTVTDSENPNPSPDPDPDPTPTPDPDDPTTEKISISGVAWIDENEDGKRTTNEKTYSNMPVYLYDYKNNEFIKEDNKIKTVLTNDKGEYKFDNLDKGTYIVVFLYNTDQYSLTEYQKDGVLESKNSDAITKTVEINQETITAGLTDKLDAETKLKNIDIGLIENKKFDLEMKKYISRVTVQTNDGKTKTYDYDNKQFAKVEINSKKINGATAIIEYKMVITNNGELDGKVAQIVDKLPDGLKFKSELNSDWYEKDGVLYTNSLSGQNIKVGESKEVKLVLTKDVNSNNVGTIINTAEIGISSNDRAVEDGNAENNTSNAQLIIGVSTGVAKTFGITIGILLILIALGGLIWKNKKLIKSMLFVSVFAICLVGSMNQVLGATLTTQHLGSHDGSTWCTGDDGRTYHCVNPSATWCSHNQHYTTGMYNSSSAVTSETDWTDDQYVPALTLSNQTNGNGVRFSQGSGYNVVGPFRVSSTIGGASCGISYTYRDKNGNVSSSSSGVVWNGWGNDFYIQISTNIVEIIKVDVSGSYSVGQSKQVNKKVTEYYNTALVNPNDANCKGRTLQTMSTSYDTTETQTRTVQRTGYAQISGPWLITGDLEITKTSNSNGNMPNVQFKISKDANTNQSMVVYKDGAKVNQLTINNNMTIDIVNHTTATVDGVGGYSVSFNETFWNGTTFITNSQAKIRINNLVYSTYKITEISNSNYGYTKMEAPNSEINPLNTKYETITNHKQVGNISITKVDSNSDSIKLKGAEFVLLDTSYQGKYLKVKVNESGSNITKDSNGWATRIVGTATIQDTNNTSSNPTVQYTSNISEATVFVTDANGNTGIKNLLASSNGSNTISYTFRETYNPNYAYTKMVDTAMTGFKTDANLSMTIKNVKQAQNIVISKIDDRNESKVLPNVEFVLKSSVQNKYIRIKVNEKDATIDGNGWATRVVGTATVQDTINVATNSTMEYTSNINEATVFVTDTNGKLKINNLLSSTNGTDVIKYQLQEIKNPNYGYLADTGMYNNHRLTFTGDAIDSTGWITTKAGVTSNIAVKNHQEYVRIEGIVWEEITNSKNNFLNNLYNKDTDALVKGIKVYLYKDNKLVTQTTTDENGRYLFGTQKEAGQDYTNEDYFTTENGNLKIDELDTYYIEFEYDGLKFTSVEALIDYTHKDFEVSSKATEVPNGRSDKKDREIINADFTEITNDSARKNGTETYKLRYDYNQNTHVSTYIDYWGYKYNNEKTRLEVTPAEYYEIIASTQTSGFSIRDAWDARCKNNGSEVLTGVNLGIQRREQPDLAISSDINTANIVVGNYENTYTYDKRLDYTNENENDANYAAAKDGFGVDVKFGNAIGSYSNRGLNMYTRRIYESDLVYYYGNSDKDWMQIYVTYRIKIKNQSMTVHSTVNELANYYDSRYTIIDSWIVNDGKTTQIGKDAWVTTSKYKNSYNDNGYTGVYTQSMANMKIGPNENIDIYIKFKLQPEAVKELIQRQTTLNNVSEITAFSTMTQNNGTWVPYAGIDEDSNPGSVKEIKLKTNEATEGRKAEEAANKPSYMLEKKELDMTYFEDDTDYAPSFIIGVDDTDPTRGLSGTVFEDENSKYNDDATHMAKERLGDGILTTDKNTGRRVDSNRVKGVTVELLNKDLSVAKLYQLGIDNSGKVKVNESEARTVTDEKGEYQLTGVMPGTYLIRYTYNQESYITDSEGNIIEAVNVRDYKSTIISSDIIKQALSLNSDSERNGDFNWILKYDAIPQNNKGNDTEDEKNKSKDLDGLVRYSGAVDDITKRNEIDDVYYATYGQNLSMTADTAYFEIGVEFNEVEGFDKKVTYTDYKDEYQLDNGRIVTLVDGRIKLVPTFYAVNPYQDFGITERARQDFTINKRLSNIKITLANGQVLMNGNPYRQLPDIITDVEYNWNNIETAADNPLPYTKALPGQVNIEIDNELLQGAQLDLEYTISIKNESEVDYNYKENQNYYYYGDSNGISKMETAIRKIVDYMDDSLVYDDARNVDCQWVKVTADELKAWKDDDEDTVKQLIANDVYNSVKNGYTIAMTEYFYMNAIPIGGIGSMKIYGSKLLSSQETGVSIDNHTEILETVGIRSLWGSMPGNYNPALKGGTPHELDDDKTTLTITPPTGLTDNKTFIISALTISLVALIGGVYFIKRKVLE